MMLQSSLRSHFAFFHDDIDRRRYRRGGERFTRCGTLRRMRVVVLDSFDGTAVGCQDACQPTRERITDLFQVLLAEC